MLFLAIFATLLVLYFGLIDPWVKRNKLRPHKGAQAVFHIAGGLLEFLLRKF
jgi:hypothetical protein